MAGFNWLAGVHNRLRFTFSRAKTRPRLRRQKFSSVPALIQILEPRCVLSAVGAVNDQFVMSVSSTPQPVALDVLTNDSSAAGGLHLVSVGATQHGTVSIAQTDPSSLAFLAYTADVGYVGTEIFDYTVADADGDLATATVTVMVGMGSSGAGSSQSGLSQMMSSTNNTVGSYLSQMNSAASNGRSSFNQTGSSQTSSGYSGSSFGSGSVGSNSPSSSGSGSYSGGSLGDPRFLRGIGVRLRLRRNRINGFVRNAEFIGYAKFEWGIAGRRLHCPIGQRLGVE